MSAPSPPEGAPEDCPGGPGAAEAGRAAACTGCPNQVRSLGRASSAHANSAGHLRRRGCADCPLRGPGSSRYRGAPEGRSAQGMAWRMSTLQTERAQVLVLSGKGGVGKSTFSSQLAFALAADGKQVRRGACPKPCQRLRAGGPSRHRHMRAEHPQDAWPGGRGGTPEQRRVVARVRVRQPGCDVNRLHAFQCRRGCHLARAAKERAHQTVPERRGLGQPRLLGKPSSADSHTPDLPRRLSTLRQGPLTSTYLSPST